MAVKNPSNIRKVTEWRLNNIGEYEPIFKYSSSDLIYRGIIGTNRVRRDVTVEDTLTSYDKYGVKSYIRKNDHNAQPYDTSKNYEIGDYCTYNDHTYICVRPITDGRSFDYNDWSEVTDEFYTNFPEVLANLDFAEFDELRASSAFFQSMSARTVTAESIKGVGTITGGNSSINFATGTFNYGDTLTWDGTLLKVDGDLNIGDKIIADGLTSALYSTNDKWRINGSGDVYFNNATIRGAIKSAVMEYDSVQAIGGILFVRPSSAIKTATVEGDDLVVTVENASIFRLNHWAKVDVNGAYAAHGNIYKIKAITDKTITLADASGVGDNAVGCALVDIGDEDGQNNYGVGINSSVSDIILPPRAITLFSTDIDSDNKTFDYKIHGVLGTLPSLSGLNNPYYSALVGKQGIYTDSAYIGDNTDYLTYDSGTLTVSGSINSTNAVIGTVDGNHLSYDSATGRLDVVASSINFAGSDLSDSLDDARKVATNYMSYDDKGLMIYNGTSGVQTPSNPGDNTNNVLIDDSSVNIRTGKMISSKFYKYGMEVVTKPPILYETTPVDWPDINKRWFYESVYVYGSGDEYWDYANGEIITDDTALYLLYYDVSNGASLYPIPIGISILNLYLDNIRVDVDTGDYDIDVTLWIDDYTPRITNIVFTNIKNGNSISVYDAGVGDWIHTTFCATIFDSPGTTFGNEYQITMGFDDSTIEGIDLTYDKFYDANDYIVEYNPIFMGMIYGNQKDVGKNNAQTIGRVARVHIENNSSDNATVTLTRAYYHDWSSTRGSHNGVQYGRYGWGRWSEYRGLCKFVDKLGMKNCDADAIRVGQKDDGSTLLTDPYDVFTPNRVGFFVPSDLDDAVPSDLTITSFIPNLFINTEDDAVDSVFYIGYDGDQKSYIRIGAPSEQFGDRVIISKDGFSMDNDTGRGLNIRKNKDGFAEWYTLAFGTAAQAGGDSSIACGIDTDASGGCSQAFGEGTIASGTSQLVIGSYNKEDVNDTYAFIIGNGDKLERSNAFAISRYAGHIYMPNNNRIYSYTTDGTVYSVLEGCNNNNNCVLGYGGYYNSLGSTNIYGNNINLFPKNKIHVGYGAGVAPFRFENFSADNWSLDANGTGTLSIAYTLPSNYYCAGIMYVNLWNANSSGQNVSRCTIYGYNWDPSTLKVNIKIRNQYTVAAKIGATVRLMFVHNTLV